MPEKLCKKKHLTSFQLIILGFAGVILLGTFLLMLPFSSVNKVPTSFHEALYRACGEGYRKLLVPDRAGDYSCTHTDRRTWSGNCGGIGFSFFREKNIPYAKKYHERCHFST